MSKVPAHYERAREIVSFSRSVNQNVLLLGNGDLLSRADAREKALTYGFDGMMLGRAVFGNPWLFSEEVMAVRAPKERIAMLLSLARRFDEMRPRKHFAIMKKHFKAFISGWDGAAELRASLMEAEDLEGFVERLTASKLV
jgi:tRNA-dihydrouridine synthase